MRQLILILASLPSLALASMAQAQDWQPLDGKAIKTALTARLLAYEDGTTQQFDADGSTIYTADKPSNGQWRVEGDQYCSVWPPSDRWSCYDIARSVDGLGIRFTGGDGSESTGKYIDKQ
jgi:hypothetical protein